MYKHIFTFRPIEAQKSICNESRFTVLKNAVVILLLGSTRNLSSLSYVLYTLSYQIINNKLECLKINIDYKISLSTVTKYRQQQNPILVVIHLPAAQTCRHCLVHSLRFSNTTEGN